MIRIDTSQYDQTIIDQIYAAVPEKRKKSKSSFNITNRLLETITEYTNQPDTCMLVISLLQHWFCDEQKKISADKINTFLTCPNPEKYIEDYYFYLARLLPSQSVVDVRLYFRWIAAQSYIKSFPQSGTPEQRAALVKDTISLEQVHLFSGICEKNLLSQPNRKTLYSSKEKINRIKWRDCDFEKHLKHINNEFNIVFKYKDWNDNFRNGLLKALQVEVCPYCNRSYISNYNSQRKKGSYSTADIDHYYIQKFYPFLSLSLFNFVPCCHICNSRFKNATDFYSWPHVNPLQQGFGRDAVFKFDEIDMVLERDSISNPIMYQIENVSEKVEIDHSLHSFDLNDIYQSHQDYVHELAKKLIIYNSPYLSTLRENFQQIFLDNGNNEMLLLVFGNYVIERDLGKRPLSKLTRDFLLQFGVFISE